MCIRDRTFGVFRHLPAQGDPVGELRRSLLGPGGVDEQGCPLVKRIVYRHAQLHHTAHRDHLGIFQRAGRGRGVRTHQPAGAQQHPAEVCLLYTSR